MAALNIGAFDGGASEVSPSYEQPQLRRRGEACLDLRVWSRAQQHKLPAALQCAPGCMLDEVQACSMEWNQ